MQELLKLAKELGFISYFNKEWKYSSKESLRQLFELTELQQWLREVHDIEVIPCPRYNSDNVLYYCYEVIKPKICSIEDLNKKMFKGIFNLYNTYELALQQGLLESLKLI